MLPEVSNAAVQILADTQIKDGGGRLTVALHGQFQLEKVRDLARRCYAAGTLLLTAYCSAEETILGPLVVPGVGACWNCARLRASAASASSAEVRADQQSCGWIDEEAAKIVCDGHDAMQAGEVRIRNRITGRVVSHYVPALPGCSICGGPERTMQTGREIEALFDKRFGIVRGVLFGTSDGETDMLPICARAAVSAPIDEKRGRLQMEDAFGKGLTKDAALQSAVGEAVERYSACWISEERLHRASYNDLGDEAFDPAWLTLYTEEQYGRPGFPYARFDRSERIDWVRGQLHSRPVWVPAIAVFQQYACPVNEAICQTTSNGLAAGDSVEDASRRAVLELIERDAVLFSWYTRAPGQRILISRADDSDTAQMMEDVEALGARVELYQLTFGMPAHTVVCLGMGDGVNWPGCTVGFGADADIVTAVRKAVMEHGQTGPYFRRVMREHREPIPAGPRDVRTLQDHELFYLPAERAAAFDFLRAGRQAGIRVTEVPEAVGSFDRLDIAFVDVTSADLKATPYRVVRAVGKHFLPVYSGYGLERFNNRRLVGRALNRDVPPIC